MSLGLLLLIIGILGFVLNKKNIILLLISIEIMLLGITLMIILTSFNYDDILGEVYGIYIIMIAGCESTIGLAILLAYYRIRGNINISSILTTK